jgi:ADP-heptose:LPS heptosyltransferase
MSWWPKSIPDYKWPREALSEGSLRRGVLTILFHAAHLAGRVARLMHRDRPAILAIRTDGIGDAVLAEPMLRSFGRRFADHELHLWAPAATCQLLRAAPYIDRRMETPRGYREGNMQVFSSAAWRARLGYRLGRHKFTAAAYLSHSPEPLGNWLFASARAARRWYSPGDTENQFQTQRDAAVKRSTLAVTSRGPRPHDLSRNAELARYWNDDIEQCMPTVHLDADARFAAAEQARTWRRVASWLGAEVVVGLMPAAALAVKKYPAAGWAQAAAELWGCGVMCALIGGPEDGAELEEVARRLGSLPHLKMKNPLDLPAMAALIGSLDGLLSVDTGLAHIALAQDVPTVTIVGGGHPKRFFPWPITRRATMLNHSMPCEGCRFRCHLRQAECVTKVDPADIAMAMANLLKRPTPLPMRAAG